MPIDISKLAQTTWTFNTGSAGEWDVYPYSVNAMSAIEKFLASEKDDPVGGVRTLMSVVCKRHIDDEENESHSEPAEEDFAKFADVDIQRFACEFLEQNQNLVEDEEEPLVKAQDQTDADFLIEVLKAENKRQRARLGEMFSSLKARLGGLWGTENVGLHNVTQDLLKQNSRLEQYFGSRPSIFEPTPRNFEPIQIPENPIHKTNHHLSDMNARLDNLIGFGEDALQIMNGLQVAAAEFLGKFSTEAEKNSKAANKAIWVGVFAVLFSVAQIAYSEFWRVPRDTATMDAALASIRGEIDELQTVLSQGLANSQAAQEAASANIADAVGTTGDTNTALLKSIDQLLQQQWERDQAVLGALDAIATSIAGSAE